MDWQSPSRSRSLGAAALLAAAAGFWRPERAPLPLLNENHDLPAGEAALMAGKNERSQTVESGLAFQEESFSLAHRELRDALASLNGLPPPGAHPQGSPSFLLGASRKQRVLKETESSSSEAESPRPLLAEASQRPSSAVKNAPTPSKPVDAAAAVPFPRAKKTPASPLPRPNRRLARKRLVRGTVKESGGAMRRAAPGLPRRKSNGELPFTASRRPAPAAAASGRERRPLFRPLLLSSLLGKQAIRPPKGSIEVPDLSPLAQRSPKHGPDGRPWTPAPARAEEVESWRPPERFLTDCRRSPGHWHQASGASLYHDGKAWGAAAPGRLGWMARRDGRWWAWTAPGEPTWLSYQGRWWWRSENVWFLLHQAQAWAYRLFLNGRAEGLIHPATGTSMIYSRDGRRVAVVTPGAGAVLFDAVSGRELARWTEDQMKPRSKPSAPSALTFPP